MNWTLPEGVEYPIIIEQLKGYSEDELLDGIENAADDIDLYLMLLYYGLLDADTITINNSINLVKTQ